MKYLTCGFEASERARFHPKCSEYLLSAMGFIVIIILTMFVVGRDCF